MIRGWPLAAIAGAVGAAGLAGGAVLRAARARDRVVRPDILGSRPLLIAHRGGSAVAPENTLLAFRQAVRDWGADMLEMDVRVTADGHAVIMHDPTVDRTTDGAGPVAEHTLEELRRLDAGYRFTTDGGRTFPHRNRGVRIPTLVEVLDALPETPIIVEVKTVRAQTAFLETVDRAGAAGRVIAASGVDADRALLSGYSGPLAASKEQLRRFYKLHRLRLGRLWAPAAALASVPEVWEGRRIVTPRFVRELRRHGIPVQVWTVNRRADMERLLEWGVDGILTDRPDVLADVLTRRAGRPPAPRRREQEEAAVE